jgi:hypothetical protein
MSSSTCKNGPMLDARFQALLAVVLCLGCVAANAAAKADESGVLRAAGVVEVATMVQLKGSSYYKDMLAHGVDEASIVDGSLVAVRLLCCRDNIKQSGLVFLYNPRPIKVAPGDFIEFRVGDAKAPNTPEEFLTLTRVLQPADQTDGRCWWEPRDDRLWMRFVFCEWMPAEGWVKQDNKMNPAWYKPAGDVE